MAVILAVSIHWIRDAADWVGSAVSSGAFWSGALSALGIATAIYYLVYRQRLQVTGIEINLPFGLGTVNLENTARDRLLAWETYVQLKTRKAALPFDDQYDVIADVHASLYELFGITRKLLSNAPLADIEKSESVSKMILQVLNEGVRPHLTRWHAGFGAWWDQQVSDELNKGNKPQSIQRNYPEYASLVEDLKNTNDELAKFADNLLQIVRTGARHQRRLVGNTVVAEPQPNTNSESTPRGQMG